MNKHICWKCSGAGEIEVCGCGLRGTCDVCYGTGFSDDNPYKNIKFVYKSLPSYCKE